LNTSPSIDSPDKRGHKSRERTCVARGEIRDPDLMLRFVVSPDGIVVPDIKGKLPGRGVWVSATREDLQAAITKGGFKRGFKSNVNIPDDLVEQVAAGLRRQMLSLIGMAKKSGQLQMGFDQVMSAARADVLGWRIEAADGSPDGRGKIRTLSKAISHELERPLPRVIGCFTADELGQVLGRDRLIHAAVLPGKLAKAIGLSAQRLTGFVPLIPEGWPDGQHEIF
jgi:predicted RNA-binding protein YlxR (DUF448 family)